MCRKRFIVIPESGIVVISGSRLERTRTHNTPIQTHVAIDTEPATFPKISVRSVSLEVEEEIQTKRTEQW